MEKGILHLHVTVVIIFLISFLVKAVLLLSNNFKQLDFIRSKTKIVEMVIGTLILITGGYLLFITKNNESYMLLKIFIVIAGIPLGIIGLKKNSKVMTIIALFIFFYAYAIAETRSISLNIGKKRPKTISSNINNDSNVVNIEMIFINNCSNCHGKDGKLKAGGSKDLSKSLLTNQEKENIITNGKGLMPAFNYSLSEKEIKDVVGYINTFKSRK